MDLISEVRSAVAEPDVSWRSLAAPFPHDPIGRSATLHTFISVGAKDANIKDLSVNKEEDTIWSVTIVAVPTVDFIEVELHDSNIGIGCDVVGLEGIMVALDEPTEKVCEPGVEIEFAIGPTSQRAILEVFLTFNDRWLAGW